MPKPAKYKPEFCALAESILARGKSLAAVCAELNITRTTLYEWRDSNPDFKESIESGLQKAQMHWESIGESGIQGEINNFGSAPWIFTMKNRFREDYAEHKDEKQSQDTSVLEKILNGEITVNK